MNLSIFDNFPQLTTDRLILRRVSAEDIPMVFEFNSDPEVLRFVPRDLYTDYDEALEKIAGFTKGFKEKKGIWWTFVMKDSGIAIGYGGLFEINAECSKAEIGYGTLKTFWGQGYVSEAVAEITRFGRKEMKLHRIYGHVDPANEPSAKILLKLGFTKEGCLHHDIHARGEYFDMDIFGLVD